MRSTGYDGVVRETSNTLQPSEKKMLVEFVYAGSNYKCDVQINSRNQEVFQSDSYIEIFSIVRNNTLLTLEEIEEFCQNRHLYSVLEEVAWSQHSDSHYYDFSGGFEIDLDLPF